VRRQEASARLGGYTQTFASDPADNLTTFKGSTQTFNSDNQQTGTGFAYDGNGNPTTYKSTALGFDVANRMTSLGSSWTAGYRADGLRAWKQNASGKTYYLYDGGEPVYEMNSEGTITATNVFAPDGLVARYSSGWTYYTFDAQGDVAQRLDSSQDVISSSVYDAFGAETTSGTAPTDCFGYNAQSGYLFDRDTGLYLCQHRYYDPTSGRWVTRDPIGYGGGIGLYAYCANGSVGSADPAGLVNPGEGPAIAEELAWEAGDISDAAAQQALEDAEGATADTTAETGGNASNTLVRGAKVASGAGAGAVMLEGLDPDAPEQFEDVCENIVQTASDAGSSLVRPNVGDPVWRAFGGDAKPMGRFWTTVDPRAAGDPRGLLGLPDENAATGLLRGIISNLDGARWGPAAPGPGGPGGWPEIEFPSPGSQVIPGPWTPLKPPF